MKKIILFLAFLYCMVFTLNASPVDVKTAKKVAENFFKNKGFVIAKSSTSFELIKADYHETDNLLAYYYVFSVQPQGFVIIAGDDNVTPVLAYSNENNFTAENMPTNIAGWLKSYQEQIKVVVRENIVATNEIRTLWEKYSVENIKMENNGAKAVAKLLNTTWNQNGYACTLYNNLCPGTGSNQAITGCVATAMAQIMKFWNWPAKGTGSHSYYSQNYGTLSANFGTTTYAWTSMPKELTCSSTSTQINAVATLIYHCGVAVEMEYSSNTSSAHINNPNNYFNNVPYSSEKALKSNFKYKSTMTSKCIGPFYAQYANKLGNAYVNDENIWRNLLKAELEAGRPILYSGNDGADGGHAFVCDGYNSNNGLDYFHFNWGWSGWGDGYYTINNLVPTQTGSGAGNGDYTTNQSVLIGIEPANVIPQSDMIWQNNSGGNSTDQYRDVTTVSDGIIAVGFSNGSSFGNGDWENLTGKGNDDAVIVKYDNSGNIVWTNNFGGNDHDYFNSVTAVPDGIIAVGYSHEGSFDNGDWEGIIPKAANDGIIIKYDFSGNVVWKKNVGGNNQDYFSSVLAVSDGFVVVGHANGNSFGNGDWENLTGKGNDDAIIIKYDFSGNVLWKNNFGGNDRDYFNSVTVVPDGLVVVGYSYSGSFENGDWIGVTAHGDADATIVKYDNNGNIVWKKNCGGSGGEQYYCVTTVSDGIVAVADSWGVGSGDWSDFIGRGGTDAIVVKYNFDGTIKWKKIFGGNDNDYFKSVTAVSDGIIAVGHSGGGSFENGDWEGFVGHGSDDAIIVKYNNDGNIVWANNFGGNSPDHYYSVAKSNDGVIAVGYSHGNSFGNGDWEGFVGKNGDDAIITKYKQSITDIKENIFANINIYPNPANDIIFIDSEDCKQTTIKLYDMLGKEVLSKNLNGKTEVNISHLPKGIYNACIFSDSKVIGNSKIVIIN